ncbi:MAG: EF-hand domain-containing protein, partial [Burkholderiales bacterium]|nr:EF-hand domain-containing protein [Burkholderiales bacterium]
VSGSNSSYFPQTGGTQRRERDTSKIAENVFSKLDTKNQGYLEVTDLETAFGNIASTSPTGATGSDSTTSSTNTTGNNTSINDLFKKLDSDGDGKVTKSEFSDGIKKLSDALETQFNARRTRGAEGSRPPPPPPPPEGGDGTDQAGLDKTQLTDLSAEVGKTNSSAGAALSQVAQNFEAADTNQDGKVSLQETLAYLEKTTTPNTQANSTSTTASTIQ